MKRILLIGTLAATLAAQGRRPPTSMAFTALDTDRDGVLSGDEIAKAATSLKALDQNHDGKITEDEVRPAFGGRGGREGGREGGRGEEREGEDSSLKVDDLIQTLMAFDRNGDGKLQKSEVPERMQGMFDRGDTDKDGVLSAAEIRVLAQAQVGASGPPEREGRGGEREGRGGGMPPGGMMRFDPILNALDQNHDGVLSAEEIAAAPAALKTLDKNQDGKITQDEVPSNFGPGRGRGGPGR